MMYPCIYGFLLLLWSMPLSAAFWTIPKPSADVLDEHLFFYDALHEPADTHMKKALSSAPKKISLKEAILLSLRMNPNIQSNELQRVLDKFDVALAYNQFEFRYGFAAGADSSQSISNGSPRTTSRNFAATPTITKLTAYGTQYNLSMENPVKYASGDPHYYYNPSLNLSVLHPLFQKSGQAVTQAQLTQSLITDQVSKLNFKNSVMLQVTQIIKDYYSVVAAENAYTVDMAALKTAKKTVEQNLIRIKIGFMAPSENVQAKSAVATQEVTIASDINAIQQAKLALLRDIGLPTSVNIEVDKTISSRNATWPGEQESAKLLFSNNITWITALFAIKSSKIQLLLAQDEQRWALNLVGNVVQGAGSGGGANGGIGSIFNGLNRSRTVGLTLSVPIDNLSIQRTVVAAKVAYTQLILSTKQLKLSLQAQLLAGLENLNILFSQIKLAQNSVALTNQSYLDAYKKATFGQASMFEVTTLQSNLITSQIQLISTEITFLNSLADYQYLMGITLDVWDIHLRY